jgi:predicted transposase/invertase (TIGR01784 family)
MTKLADPKNDVAFKMIFNPNNLELIKDFLESVIKCANKFPFDPNIAELEFLNKDQLPHLIGGKRSLCDLKVKDAKGKTYIIEMQKRNESDYLKRIQYYASHSLVEQLV